MSKYIRFFILTSIQFIVLLLTFKYTFIAHSQSEPLNNWELLIAIPSTAIVLFSPGLCSMIDWKNKFLLER